MNAAAKKICCLFTISVVFASGLQAQRIQSSEQRRQLLDQVESLLGTKENFEDIAVEAVTPFSKPQPEIPEVVHEVGADSAPEPPKPVLTRMEDRAALEMIAARFTPTGGILMGEKGYLQLQGGGLLAAGDSFKAKIQGFEYEVTVKNVLQDRYTLSLGSASLERDFTKQPDSSRIRRTQSGDGPGN